MSKEQEKSDACDWLENLEGDAWADACEEIAASVRKQAEGAQGEPLPYWEPCNPACDPELNGFRDRKCSCAQARAALAQPSPAPKLSTEDELEAAGLGYPLAKEEAVKLWYSGFRSEVITVLEAWEAIGHDIGMNPDKGELLASLRYMLEKCEAHDAAQARVAELERALQAVVNAADHGSWPTTVMHGIEKARAVLASDGPVAQAGQVPDGCAPGTYAIDYLDNWDGEGDRYFCIAEKTADGKWIRHESGQELLEYKGDAILAAWLLAASEAQECDK
ncbi:hypothetical protein SAMN05216189_105333 [Pseudomonas delhiensis]|uniref:Uncharacterized protein n=1 Tax=Pseudomonas delhiensis TaxID=366289 RepID=A0A239NK12_9PSED|nr:hypothetical protein [Pseudomonas delhiensis]SDK82600.1 hypothetical protein SAMN05216189_105333 [Pseudomonas delhiensis]SNT55090.1 hypothetical protein SAMN06295949_15019 [Pseudomonas delhiensis]